MRRTRKHDERHAFGLNEMISPGSDGPEHTAVRVALWRALHVQIDATPHVLTDEIGLKLVGEENWRARQDMNAHFSKPMRASVVGRARFVEDLVEVETKCDVRSRLSLAWSWSGV